MSNGSGRLSTVDIVQLWAVMDEDSKQRLFYSAIMFDKRVCRAIAIVVILLVLAGLKIITAL